MAGGNRKNRTTRNGFRKGFTLIELLVSMVIFVIFMGIVSSSFVSIVRAQKDTNEVRKMYAVVRNFIESVSEEARLGTVDYDCYATVAAAYSMNACPVPDIKAIANGRTTDLALVRKDGLQKTVFRYDPDKKTVRVVKYASAPGGIWVLEPGFTGKDGFQDALGSTVKVDSMAFVINPDVNPYSNDKAVYLKSDKQFQPMVTLLMSVSSGQTAKSTLKIDFETTISSRVYSRQ